MVTPELGTKRVCPKCARKFYDLKKSPAVCPGCSHSFDPDAAVKKRAKKRGKTDVAEKSLAASTGAKPEAEDDIELPEFEDLGIMEDLEELDDMDVEVDGVKKTSPHNNDEADEEETFLDEDEILTDDSDDEDESGDDSEEEEDSKR